MERNWNKARDLVQSHFISRGVLVTVAAAGSLLLVLTPGGYLTQMQNALLTDAAQVRSTHPQFMTMESMPAMADSPSMPGMSDMPGMMQPAQRP
jgi:hypothetical protein